MKQSNKRLKVTKESTIADIATSIEDISKTLGSIGQIHSLLLKSNEVIVKHILSIEEEKKKLNYSAKGDTTEALDKEPAATVPESEPAE